MKLVKEIVKQIWDEIEGAEEYIELALSLKEEYPNIAENYYEMSVTEMSHYEKLHKAVMDLIKENKEKGKEPTPEMLAIYNYEHDKATDKATKILVMQEMYKR